MAKMTPPASQVKHILGYVDIDPAECVNSKLDLDDIDKKLMEQARRSWAVESTTKPKLRTFIRINDYENPGTLIESNLPRVQRSLVTTFKAGVLLLKVETGRYKGTKDELRYCDLCRTKKVEDELHFIFECPALKYTRDPFIKTKRRKLVGDNGEDVVLLKLLLSKDHIKEFGVFLAKMYTARKSIMYT